MIMTMMMMMMMTIDVTCEYVSYLFDRKEGGLKRVQGVSEE